MRVSGGRLSPTGTEVHAASFLRKRLIVLDRELLRDASELRRIWLHELFHFVWPRLANRTRRSWEEVLLAERSRGELGWSAQWRKNLLTASDRRTRSRRWREYCAESFCDTAAWIRATTPSHREVTLSQPCREARRNWWAAFARYTFD